MAAVPLKVPAILILNKNKTYGRLDGGRLLYRAVPNDATLSPILVPYTIKSGFSKAYVNMYVLLEPWDSNAKHTTITEVIGAVDILDNTYTYELHCKGLWLPTPPAFKRPYIPPVFTADDTAAPATIFTIDGPTTRDFDDAFSIRYCANSGITELGIYISNVPLILAHMGLLTELVAGQKMSSIYLPNKVVPMLPTRFSEGLCSLRADGIIKPCFKLLFGINSDGGIVYYSTNTANVIISHNYVYETAELLDSPDYTLLSQTTNAVFNCATFEKNPKFARTFNFMTCPQTSDEIVAYWMLMMNWIMSQNATRHDTGSTYKPIYRADELIIKSGSVAPTPATLIQDILDPEIEKAIRRRYTDSDTHFVGEYTTTPRQHHTLDIPTYMHITSPIRRMPDVINIAIHMLCEEHILCKLSTPVHQQIIQALDIYQSAHADFVTRINTQMYNIKRAQRQCDLLAAAATLLPDATRRQYAAILCCMRNDVEKNEWEIYIPEMRLFTTVIAPFDTDTIHRNVICELYAFHDAVTTRRFIRVGLVQPAV